MAGQEKDFKSTLNNLLDVFKFIVEKYDNGMESANIHSEIENKLSRKEENGQYNNKIELDLLCMHHPNNDSNQNSEYAPDDDADIELNVLFLNSEQRNAINQKRTQLYNEQAIHNRSQKNKYY